MATEVLEIDSKGICVLCLKAPPEADNDDCPDSESSKSSSSLKMFLRYLKINIATLANFKSEILLESGDSPTDNNFNIAASLCDECNSEVDNFWKLYKLWEATRLQLDQTVQKISHLINAGDEESARRAEFRRRFGTGKLSDKFNASVVENIRKKTKEKCRRKITKESIPRVKLRREEEMEFAAPTPASPPPRPPPPPPPTNSHNVAEDSTCTQQMDLNMTFEQMIVKVEPFTGYFDNDAVLKTSDVADVEFEDDAGLRASIPIIDEEALRTDVGDFMNHGHSIFGTGLDLEIDEDTPAHAGRQRNKVIRKSKSALTGSSLKRRSAHHRVQRKPKSNAVISCDFCSDLFSFQKSRIPHMILIHPVHLFKDFLPSSTTNSDFKLALCSITENCWKSEGSSSPNKSLFQCPSCPKSVCNESRLRYHLARNHLDVLVLKIEENIGVRVGGDKRILYQSEGERKKFKQKVNAHVRSLHVPRPSSSQKTYNCKFCGGNYKTFWELEDHMLLEHAVEELATKLPQGTTPNEFGQVLTDLINAGNKREFWCCPQCTKRLAKKETTEEDWSLHLLKEHLNALRDTLRMGRVEVVQEKL